MQRGLVEAAVQVRQEQDELVVAVAAALGVQGLGEVLEGGAAGLAAGGAGGVGGQAGGGQQRGDRGLDGGDVLEQFINYGAL